MFVCGSSTQAPPSLPMGTRDMDSTPPTTTRSSKPERTFIAPRFTASRPEAQKRLICTPATLMSQSATSAAVLAMSAPWSPTGVTQPSTMSSTWRVSVAALCQRGEQTRHQVYRLDAMQGAVGLAFAPGRAYRIKDQSLGHDILERSACVPLP